MAKITDKHVKLYELQIDRDERLALIASLRNITTNTKPDALHHQTQRALLAVLNSKE